MKKLLMGLVVLAAIVSISVPQAANLEAEYVTPGPRGSVDKTDI